MATVNTNNNNFGHRQLQPTTTTTKQRLATTVMTETPKKQRDPADRVPKPMAKHQCPSPPSVLQDKKQTVHFTKGRFLGEGGFARCYEVWDTNGKRSAAKVVPKASLKSDKQKQKLFTEIKIHQSLKHPNVVRFNHVFEDSENVYMILELCENQTFVDMLKKRRRLSEPETQYYMLQLLDALRYLHSKRVIHRDLKLGNLFLTSDMVMKIGDFGLATVVKTDGERKKTICGTPNYIAPEILFDTKHGHSFEVDMWSLGVIMYTFLIGRPPFQTKDVKTIYKNIKANKYEFPSTVDISPMAKDLIESLLTSRPDMRPTIAEARLHRWFNVNNIPKHIPVTALECMPRFDIIMSSKTPLKVGYPTQTALAKENMHSVQTFKSVARQSNALQPKDLNTPSKLNVLAPVKAVTVYQTPVIKSKPVFSVSVTKQLTGIKQPMHKMTETPIQKTNALLAAETPMGQLCSPAPNMRKQQLQLTPPMNTGGRKSMLEVMLGNLTVGLKALKDRQLQSALRTISVDTVQVPTVFVSKWIDYSNKYGLGYQLTNGCVGVHFNDSTHIILSPNDNNFEYLQYARGSEKTVMNRHGHTLTEFPDDLQKKVTLLTHFKSYMQENLHKASQYTFQDPSQNNNMDFLVKYMRTKHAVMFRLTNRLVQINFFDHTKLILSQDAKVVSFINKDREISTWSLQDVLVDKKSEVVSRLKYSRDILETLIHGRKEKPVEMVV